MTMCAGPGEDTRPELPVRRFFRPCAFRVLSVAADAEPKAIDRQHNRLLIAIELDPSKGEGACGLKHLSQEEVSEAAHLLATPDGRLLEELFWVHGIDCGAGLREGPSAALFSALREAASKETCSGVVARHNLAVLQAIRGQESDHNAWEEALQAWKSVLDDELFWHFMKNRAVQIEARSGHPAKMISVVRQRLSAGLAQQLVLAGRAKDVKAAANLAKVVFPHRHWLELDAALKSVGEQVAKEGFVSLGAVLDRVAELGQQDSPGLIHRVLAREEKELGCIALVYGNFIRLLDEMATDPGWQAAVCAAYQRLSLASRLLGEPEQAMRLMAQACEFVDDPRLRASLLQDCREVQCSMLISQATALLQAGDFEAADLKLADALALAGKEQKKQVGALQQTCGFARTAASQQRRLEQRNSLCQQAEAYLQKGQFAEAEQRLTAAMAFCTVEEKTKIEALQNRCRWMRVLQGVDIACTRPLLYRIGGVGSTFVGERDYDPATQSYLTNHWFTVLFIPALPIATYRVSDAGAGSYRIYGRVALPHLLKRAQWVIAAAVVALTLAAMIGGRNARKTGADAGLPRISAPAPHPAPRPASEDLEPERTAIIALAQSLADRQRRLELENSELEKQRSELQTVAAAYHREAVPLDGQAVYGGVSADYNSRVQKYKRKVVQLQADAAAYHDRVRSFHAREEANRIP